MFFSGKRVLVTGGAGFVGTHLCRALVARGAQVVSLDNYVMGSRENHVPGVTYIDGHTKDVAQHVTGVVDLVYHLGEYSRIEVSFNEPELVWDLNIAGTFGVVSFWRSQNMTHPCKLIYAGSSTKFADGGLGRDQSPYAWTKATNTELVRNYAAWFHLPFAITYFYNVYGPGERSDRYGTVIEIFRRKRLANEPLGIVLPGTQQRIFTHVEDIVSGLLLVGERGDGDGFGLGASEAYSIRDVAEMFGGEIVMLPERAGNRSTATLDATKAQELGWYAKHSLTEYVASVCKQV